MSTSKSAQELWSTQEPNKPVLIMGNSDSINLHTDDVYESFYTIGCNSRLHTRYVPDLTLMVDKKLPDPPKGSTIITQRKDWSSHEGVVYLMKLGSRLKFHPDISTNKVDYSITTAYMAIVIAYMMGWRTIHLVGIDLGAVNGVDYHRDETDLKHKEVSDTRKRFFAQCFNHLTYLINKMAKYHKIRFFSLSPHSKLLTNGHVKVYKHAN